MPPVLSKLGLLLMKLRLVMSVGELGTDVDIGAGSCSPPVDGEKKPGVGSVDGKVGSGMAGGA
jgi:hypothetical protein